MADHRIERCRHGVVARQCRCIGPHQVQIVDCPDVCVLARHRGAEDVYEAGVQTLVDHQRMDAGSCLCGWDELGRSHSVHVLEQLLAAGWTPPVAREVRRG